MMEYRPDTQHSPYVVLIFHASHVTDLLSERWWLVLVQWYMWEVIECSLDDVNAWKLKRHMSSAWATDCIKSLFERNSFSEALNMRASLAKTINESNETKSERAYIYKLRRDVGQNWMTRMFYRSWSVFHSHTVVDFSLDIEWLECFLFLIFFLTVSIQFILCFDYHTLSGYSKIIIRPVWGNSIYMACSCFWTYMHASVLYALESINYLFKSELFILCFGST